MRPCWGRAAEENLRAIKKCQELGIKFVPATGRGFYSLRQTLEELGQADQSGQYTICYNGGAVFENKGPRLDLLYRDGRGPG